MVLGFDCKTVGIFAYHLLETVRNRLLDLFLLELDEPPRRMEAFVPDSLLLRWKIRNSSGNIGHMLLANTKAST